MVRERTQWWREEALVMMNARVWSDKASERGRKGKGSRDTHGSIYTPHTKFSKPSLVSHILSLYNRRKSSKRENASLNYVELCVKATDHHHHSVNT